MKIKAVTYYEVVLTPGEIKFLRDILQNPVYDDETADEERIRGGLFNSFREAMSNEKQHNPSDLMMGKDVPF